MPQKPALTVSDDARRQAVAALRQYVADNFEEQIGELKAGLLFDFILSELGPTIYNQAIADARAFFEDRVADLSGVCYVAEFPSSVRRKQ